MPKIITMTAYRRPEYTQQVLDSLAACTGVADWLFLPCVEPGPCIDVIKSFDACAKRVQVNPARFGLNRNTNQAMRIASQQLDLPIVVHIEDDTVLSPDALLYFEWAVQHLDDRTLLASGYNKPELRPSMSETFKANKRNIFTPWGWAVDKRRLAWMLRHWNFRNPRCFTCYFKKKYRGTHYEVYPLLSRVQNIGYELGENERTPEWYEANHRTPWVSREKEGKFILQNFG
jgi:hypothetical protein